MVTSKIEIRKNFVPSNIEGASELTEKQATALANSNSISLRKDLIYVVPAQLVHREKLRNPVNGNTHSNKVFVFGVNADGALVEVTTLSMNSLRATHFGPVPEKMPKIQVEVRDNLDRIPRNAIASISVFENGGIPFVLDGKNARVAATVAFKMTDRKICLTASYTQKPGTDAFNVDSFEEDGKKYVKFGSQGYNSYSQVDNVPELPLEAFLDENEALKPLFA